MSSPAYERPNRSVNGANQNNGNSDELDVRRRAALQGVETHFLPAKNNMTGVSASGIPPPAPVHCHPQ